MFDALYKIIWFSLIALVCWRLLYILSPYNPSKPNAKYITVNNKTMAKLLISKRNPGSKYVKVKDRNKLYLPCFVGYIVLLIIIIVSLIITFLPPMPCDPTVFPIGRYSRVVVSTYNEKIPLSLILLFALAIFLYVFIPLAFSMFAKKDQSVKKGTKVFIFFIILLWLFLAGYLLITLI